jgi:hypothetical protein
MRLSGPYSGKYMNEETGDQSRDAPTESLGKTLSWFHRRVEANDYEAEQRERTGRGGCPDKGKGPAPPEIQDRRGTRGDQGDAEPQSDPGPSFGDLQASQAFFLHDFGFPPNCFQTRSFGSAFLGGRSFTLSAPFAIGRRARSRLCICSFYSLRLRGRELAAAGAKDRNYGRTIESVWSHTDDDLTDAYADARLYGTIIASPAFGADHKPSPGPV